MKSIFLLLSLPLLILSQYYGVPNNSPSNGYDPAPVAAGPFTYFDSRHDILYPPRRRHHYHTASRSSSDLRYSSFHSEYSCRRLKSKCERNDDNCCEAIVRSDFIKCKGNREDIVQLQDGEGNLIDYGFGEVEVDLKCQDERWYARSFKNKKLEVKNVICYRIALPAIVDMSEFEKARTTPFDIESFFNKDRVSDGINWSAAVFTNNKYLLDDKEVQKSLTNLDAAIIRY